MEHRSSKILRLERNQYDKGITRKNLTISSKKMKNENNALTGYVVQSSGHFRVYIDNYNFI